MAAAVAVAAVAGNPKKKEKSRMNVEEEQVIICPYCGESIHVMIDCSYVDQEYIEDCQVCCRPITFQVSYREGNSENNSIQISVHHENE